MLRPPPIRFRDEGWSSERLEAMAHAWLGALPPGVARGMRPLAMVMANNPASVALFFALSTLPAPLILLPPEPQSWRTRPPLPGGTVVVLAPGTTHLAPDAARIGLEVAPLPAPDDGAVRGAPPAMFAFPGVVAFTSGSTGGAKPVNRSADSLLMEARAIALALGLGPGDPVINSLPLAGIHGLVNGLLLASVLTSPLRLQERFEHRELLNLFGLGNSRYWATTPFMVDVMSNCTLSGPAPAAPPMCKVSGGRLRGDLFLAFAKRFGVRIRPAYGTTENGIITADMAPAALIRPEAVGQAVPGIELRVGDGPLEPCPPGVTGRVWFTSPWYMEGYGFPPDLEPRRDVHGWWATQDIGRLDEAGYLTLVGRLDDSFKTVSGYLVNPGEIDAALRRHPGVVDTAVTPVPGSTGPQIGVLVETRGGVEPNDLYTLTVSLLPQWSRPQIIVVTDRLPRLTTGKIDHAACLDMLTRGHP